MKRIAGLVCAGLLFVACGDDPPPETEETTEEVTVDPNLNSNGDCMTDVEKTELGLDPFLLDSDLDGVFDCDELLCVSDPLDVNERCYYCGWKHNDPGTIVPSGAALGNVMAEVTLTDQCGDQVSLWDFYGSYHVLYMTAAW